MLGVRLVLGCSSWSSPGAENISENILEKVIENISVATQLRDGRQEVVVHHRLALPGLLPAHRGRAGRGDEELLLQGGRLQEGLLGGGGAVHLQVDSQSVSQSVRLKVRDS